MKTNKNQKYNKEQLDVVLGLAYEKSFGGTEFDKVPQQELYRYGHITLPLDDLVKARERYQEIYQGYKRKK